MLPVSGFGLALMYLPAMVMVGYYFEKRRAMAAGIATSGSGFGILVLAPLAAYLANEYHWRGAIILLAGIMLQGLVLGALMRPLELPTQQNSQSESELTEEEDCLLAEQKVQSQEKVPIPSFAMNSRSTLHSCDSLQTPSQTCLPRPDESVQLYRRALQNALASKMAESTSMELQSPDDDVTRKKAIPAGTSKSQLQFENHVIKNGGKMSSTQSCHEIPAHTAETASSNETRRFRFSNRKSDPDQTPAFSKAPHHRLQASRSKALAVRSCHEISPRAHHYRQETNPITTRQAKLLRELLNPLHRQDIFYSGSIASLPQYKSHPDLQSYLASVTVLPDHPSQTGPAPRLCPCIPRPSRLNGLSSLLDVTIVTNPYFLVICLASVFIQVSADIACVYAPHPV